MASSELQTYSQVPALDKEALDCLKRRQKLWALIMAEGRNDLEGTGSNTKQWPPITDDIVDVNRTFGDTLSANEKRIFSNPQLSYKVRAVLSTIDDDNVDTAHGQFAVRHNLGDRKDFHINRITSAGNKQLFNNSATLAGWDGLRVLDGSPTYTNGIGTSAVADSATYAGVSMGYNYFGTGDNAGCWTPQHLTATQDVWGNSGTTWYLNCLDVLERASLAVVNKHGGSFADSVVIMNQADAATFRRRARAQMGRYDFAVESSKMAKLGFAGEIEYNGMTIVYDDDCPTGYAFIINLKSVGIWTPAKELISTKMSYDANKGRTTLRTRLLGNLVVYQPANQAVLITA